MTAWNAVNRIRSDERHEISVSVRRNLNSPAIRGMNGHYHPGPFVEMTSTIAILGKDTISEVNYQQNRGAPRSSPDSSIRKVVITRKRKIQNSKKSSRTIPRLIW